MVNYETKEKKKKWCLCGSAKKTQFWWPQRQSHRRPTSNQRHVYRRGLYAHRSQGYQLRSQLLAWLWQVCHMFAIICHLKQFKSLNWSSQACWWCWCLFQLVLMELSNNKHDVSSKEFFPAVLVSETEILYLSVTSAAPQQFLRYEPTIFSWTGL